MSTSKFSRHIGHQRIPKRPPPATHLAHLHHHCERNFARLRTLMPCLENGTKRTFRTGPSNAQHLQIEVTDTARYTRHLSLTGHTPAAPWTGPQNLEVRLYLDARMAEVTRIRNQRIRLLRYPYPNPHMYSTDEKIQINRFLGSWLQHFIDCGAPSAKHLLHLRRSVRQLPPPPRAANTAPRRS